MSVRLPLPSGVLSGVRVPRPSAGKVDDPRNDIWLGAGVATSFFVILMGWSALTPMDAAVSAPGEIAISQHSQTIQHREGGVISAIHVAEGQKVKAGDVLIELAGADVRAGEEALQAQMIDLQARKARLQAELSGASQIEWPAEWASLSGADQQAVEQAKAVQTAQLRAHAVSLATQRQVLNQKVSELGELQRGYQSQIESTTKQQELIGQELQGMQSLAARGYAPMSRVRELERSQAQIQGEHGQYVASIAQSKQEARQTRSEVAQVGAGDGDKIATELSEVEASIADATPKLEAARDLLAKTQIRAPVSGQVVGLSVFTVGGVIAPGQKLMDVVPEHSPMIVEVRISPNDAQELRAGQKAEIRFPSVHDRSLPIMDGRVTSVSADSLVDAKSGARYFTAEVSAPLDRLSTLERERDPNFAVRPGMPAQVMIPLRKRSALNYLTEPLGGAIWSSFRQR